MGYVKITGHKDPSVATTEVILEREDGDSGEVKTAARVGEPVQLSADQKKAVESMGFIVEGSSAEEAKQYATTGIIVGDDVADAAPVMTASSNPAPGVSVDQSNESGDKSSAKQ